MFPLTLHPIKSAIGAQDSPRPECVSDVRYLQGDQDEVYPVMSMQWCLVLLSVLCNSLKDAVKVFPVNLLF